MNRMILRVTLVVVLAAGLGGLAAPAPVQSAPVIPERWTDSPPVLDGKATAAEWGNAALLDTFNYFRVRFMNDDTFLYILIDVNAETTDPPPDISGDENFDVVFDTTGDGLADMGYTFDIANPNPLLRRWAPSWEGSHASSYAAHGFGPSLAIKTPHRIYEMAIRMPEIPTMVGNDITTRFRVESADIPGGFYQTALITLGTVSPQVAFIYYSQQGYEDGVTILKQLKKAAGLDTTLVALNAVAATDFSPYRMILVGDDTSADGGATWLGTAAAVMKIRTSGKPVLGFGDGGLALFGALGSYLSYTHSAAASDDAIQTLAVEHPAWNKPNAVATTPPLSLYSAPVDNSHAIIINPDPNRLDFTLLGARNVLFQYYILGEHANGTCYTLWGFKSQPMDLTEEGQKLLANLAWQPPCMPAVIGLYNTNTALRDSFMDLLEDGGFPHAVSPASVIESVNFTPYEAILTSWDISWTVARLNAVRNSHLPVVAMGSGGTYLLHYLGLPMAVDYGYSGSPPQTEVNFTYPLLPVLWRPNRVAFPSSLQVQFDPEGFNFGYIFTPITISETVIANEVLGPGIHTIAAQSFNGVCFTLYGLESLYTNMTSSARGLLRNILAAPPCNFPVFVPLIEK